MQWGNEAPKCPACSAPAAAEAAECAACGVVFAKWKARAESAPAASPERPSQAAPAVKGAGAALLLAALGLAGGLLSGGSSRAPAAGSIAMAGAGAAFAAPAGWKDVAESECGGVLKEPCLLRAFDRGDDAARGFPSALQLRVFPAWERERLEDALSEEVRAGIGEGAVAEPAAAKVDGVEGFRVEGRGKKHFRLETAAAVTTNAAAALAEQQRLNPNKGVYTVMAAFNPRNPNNGVVTLKEAEYAEYDAKPVLGRVAVPRREGWLVASYQYDEASEATGSGAADELLSSLRVTSRRRPMDALGGAASFAAFGAAAFLGLTGVKLLLA